MQITNTLVNSDDMSTKLSRRMWKVPHFGFKVTLNHEFPLKWNQNLRPRWRQVIALIPLVLRYVIYFIKIVWAGRRPLMDYWNTQVGKQIYGAPIGGLGSGTIGRGFKGEFCRYQMRPGLYEYKTVAANQFIVTIQNDSGCTLYQEVLSTYKKPKNRLSSWSWNFASNDGEYTALYPRAWTVYNIGKHNIRLTCRQVSPVIPHNYKDSCIPGAVFIWTIENNSDAKMHVSITFIFKNGNGTKEDRKGGVTSKAFEQQEGGVVTSGVLIAQTFDGMPCTYGIAGLQSESARVSHTLYVDPCGSGKTVWEDLLKDGKLEPLSYSSHTTLAGEELACAVCIQCSVDAQSSSEAEFALVWDMPKIHFNFKKKEYYRFYTKWFGNKGNSAPILCHYALSNYARWEEEIVKWQQPVLDDPELPAWYKSALFNELYFVADGGSIWLIAEESDNLKKNDPRCEYGRFAYLEGHEYRMYNTYDVHFYASFALALLWPKLQAVLQYDFCDAIGHEDTTPRTHLYDGTVSSRKVKNSVPHDIGDPDEEPYLMINSYPIHDVSEWRDLNLKFVLQCYRDYVISQDKEYLKVIWPRVRDVMVSAMSWDSDGDGLIENGGFPDQTYDNWVMEGPSAYCGSLWLAALYLASKIAELNGDVAQADNYLTILEKGKKSFEEKLWNGKYYNFDSSESNAKSIMSDQLCGQWYLRACGVDDEVFPKGNVLTALDTIFNFNVMKFKNGTMGAVNGMTPDGKTDLVSIQSEEVWIGVVYGLAALMIHEGKVKEGFKTAEGIYNTVYEKIGMGFETPEALYTENQYRAIGYMRPLSIWAMQHAWEMRKKLK